MKLLGPRQSRRPCSTTASIRGSREHGTWVGYLKLHDKISVMSQHCSFLHSFPPSIKLHRATNRTKLGNSLRKSCLCYTTAQSRLIEESTASFNNSPSSSAYKKRSVHPRHRHNPLNEPVRTLQLGVQCQFVISYNAYDVENPVRECERGRELLQLCVPIERSRHMRRS